MEVKRDMQEAWISTAFAVGTITGASIFGAIAWLAVEVSAHKLSLCEMYQIANEQRSKKLTVPTKLEEQQPQYSLQINSR